MHSGDVVIYENLATQSLLLPCWHNYWSLDGLLFRPANFIHVENMLWFIGKV
jgi:hypothetical protein